MQKPTRPNSIAPKQNGPAAIPTGVFAQWQGLAESNRKLPYISLGTYLLRVSAVKTGYSKKQVGVAYFVIEGDIVAVAGASENQVGQTVSRPITLKTTRAMQESRAIVAAIYGIAESEVTEADGIAATENDGQNVVGSVIYVEATQSPWTDPKTGAVVNFTNCFYAPADSEIAKLRFP